MTTGPRPPAGDGMGLLHSTLRRRIRAFVPAIAVLALVLGPSWAAANGPAAPAQAMTVTVDLDRAAYLTGDLVQARAIVYRTPIPANYTLAWEVRDPLVCVPRDGPRGGEPDPGRGDDRSGGRDPPRRVLRPARLRARRDDPRAPRPHGPRPVEAPPAVRLAPHPRAALRHVLRGPGDHDGARGRPVPPDPLRAGRRRRPRGRVRVVHGSEPVRDPPHRLDEPPLVHGSRRDPPVRDPPGPPVPPDLRCRHRTLASNRRGPCGDPAPGRHDLGPTGGAVASPGRAERAGPRPDVRRLCPLRPADRAHDEPATDRGHVSVVRGDPARRIGT